MGGEKNQTFPQFKGGHSIPRRSSNCDVPFLEVCSIRNRCQPNGCSEILGSPHMEVIPQRRDAQTCLISFVAEFDSVRPDFCSLERVEFGTMEPADANTDSCRP